MTRSHGYALRKFLKIKNLDSSRPSHNDVTSLFVRHEDMRFVSLAISSMWKAYFLNVEIDDRPKYLQSWGFKVSVEKGVD